MLKNFDFEKKSDYSKFSTHELGLRLARLQRVAQSMNIPVLFIMDGWESSGKGYAIKYLVRELNPKYMDVDVFERMNSSETDYPFLHRFWINIPQKGSVKVFDKSFYYQIMDDLNISKSKLEERIDDIKSIENILYSDYTVICKFFLHITEKTQKERIAEFLKSDSKQYYVDKYDLIQNERYDEYLEHIDRVLTLTNFTNTPWHIINSEHRKNAAREILGIAIEQMESGIERVVTARKGGTRIKRKYKPENMPLNDVDLTKTLNEDKYNELLKPLQKQVADLMLKYAAEKIPTVLVFEGVDAAGKDGAIERLIRYVDPRLVNVHAISAPDQSENSYNYLWRFYTKLPPKGKIGIFSRSWYGRVMVERIEGFAQDNEWERAYNEMLEMEKQLSEFGALVLKYFVVIDKDEQLKRFEDREADPDKQYKITSEDWRNRDKWDKYISAMNEMLDRTNTDFAPWIIVEGNDKKYARIKVLKTFLDYAEKHYEKITENKGK